MSTTKAEQRGRAVRRALLVVLFLNLGITTLKIVLGLSTGALSVVADGIHSLVDASSNLIGLAMLRLADRRADEKHPYGYQRFETLGALLIGVLMVLAAFEIVVQAINHWKSGGVTVEPVALYVMVIAFAVNLTVVWWETTQGKRWQSELLLADSAHTKSDIWVTGTVIASLVGMRLGLQWLDPVVALVIAVLIIATAWEILTTAAQYLTDASVVEPQKIEQVALSVPGVSGVYNIRSRGRPGAAFVDLRVRVPAGMSTQQAHALADEIERRLVAEIPDVVEALVHVEPFSEEKQSPWLTLSTGLRRLADGLGLGIHEIYIHALPNGKYSAEMHLEFPADISLADAHKQAQAFTRRVSAEMPELAEVVLHLEPLPTQISPAKEEHSELEESVKKFASEHCRRGKIRSLQLRRSDSHITAIVRCLLPPEMPLVEAHALADDLQRAILLAFPELTRALVEVEPTER